jgi:hypothetical protein
VSVFSKRIQSQGFCSSALSQPSQQNTTQEKIQTLFYEFAQSDRLVDLFLGLEMPIVYFPSSCEPQAISSEVIKDALSNNLRIRPW